MTAHHFGSPVVAGPRTSGATRLWAVSAIGLLLSTPASAAMRRCDRHDITQPDRQRLNAASAAALPRVVFDGLASYCRNPDSARSWLETRPRKALDGAREWWSLYCKRDRVDWTCDPPMQHRQTKIDEWVNGQWRRITIDFDQHTRIEDARTLTRRGLILLQIAFSPDSPRQCNTPNGAPASDDRLAWNRAKGDSLRPDVPLQFSLENENGRFTAWTGPGGGLALTFERTDTPPTGFRFICWEEWVVVA